MTINTASHPAKACALFCMGLALSACATTVSRPSDFLPATIALEPSAFKNVDIYKAQGFDKKTHGKLRFVPSVVYSPTAQLQQLDAESKQEALSHLDKELSEQMKTVSTGIATELVVKAVLTDLVTPNRALNVATTFLIGPVTSGGATVELKIADERTGNVVFAATCTERASVLWQLSGAYSLPSHAKHAITECVQRFAQAYGTPHAEARFGAPLNAGCTTFEPQARLWLLRHGSNVRRAA